MNPFEKAMGCVCQTCGALPGSECRDVFAGSPVVHRERLEVLDRYDTEDGAATKELERLRLLVTDLQAENRRHAVHAAAADAVIEALAEWVTERRR